MWKKLESDQKCAETDVGETVPEGLAVEEADLVMVHLFTTFDFDEIKSKKEMIEVFNMITIVNGRRIS